ncbi:MAG: cache domain-containing protein [Rhodocyclaceae bacterium]|nr:cache domain-containing protein [Rhodocyclaceae bacterium]
MSNFRHVGFLVGALVLSNMSLATEPLKQPVENSRYAMDAYAAKDLLGKAVAFYLQEGDQALPVFSRQGPFIVDNLYVFVLNSDGVMLASGGPSVVLLGRDVSPAMPDEVRARLLKPVAEGEEGVIQEVEYPYVDWSLGGRTVNKHLYFQRVGNRILAVGYYQPRADVPQAQHMLDAAVEAVASRPQETFAAINALDRRFYQDDLYVFVVDLDSKRFVAHGSNIRLVGRDFIALLAPDGQPIGQRMFDIAAQKGKGEYDYVWPNPVTGKDEPKRALIRRVGNYLVAVGYYYPR